MNKYQQIGLRIAISTGVGVLVAVIAVVVAWRNIASMKYVRPEQSATREAIYGITDLIQQYRGTSQAQPGALEEVQGP